jgi:hypothetical protein
LDRLGKNGVSNFTILLFGVLFGLFFSLFLLWLLFTRSTLLFGVFFDRVLLFHLFGDGFGNIKKFDVFFELIIVELISVMELEFQAGRSDFFLQLYRIHQPCQEDMFVLPENLILPDH